MLLVETNMINLTLFLFLDFVLCDYECVVFV